MNAPARIVATPEVNRNLSPSDAAAYVRGLERLVSALKLLSAARDLDAVMTIVRRAAREIAGADGATLILREGELCFYADEDAIAPLWKGRRFPMSDCISGWSMLNAQPVVLEDIYLDDRIPAAAYRSTFVKSLVVVPIGAATPLGAIGNYWSRHHRARPFEVQLLRDLADATASALENLQRASALDAELTTCRKEREDLNREPESLTHSVSHDLHAPLRAVVGFNQALLEDHLDQLGPEGVSCVRRVHTSAHRLSRLIDDVLELSRVVRAELRPRPVNLSALAEDIVADLRRADSARTVRISIAPDLRTNGDSRLLRRALAALLGNAWKFTRSKSSAEIHLLREELADGDRFVVRDNGVGFDEEYASKLFTPFQRLHASEEYPGNGIGLALVKRIILRHGGRVFAAGHRGDGASFAFALPR